MCLLLLGIPTIRFGQTQKSGRGALQPLFAAVDITAIQCPYQNYGTSPQNAVNLLSMTSVVFSSVNSQLAYHKPEGVKSANAKRDVEDPPGSSMWNYKNGHPFDVL